MKPADDRLIAGLRALGDEVAWPPTPDFAARVPDRGQTPSRPLGVGSDRFTVTRRVAVAVAAALVLAVGIAAVPPARSAVAELLGLEGGETIRRVPAPPPAPRTRTPAQAPGATSTLARARAAVRFPVRVPAVLGPPDRVRLWDGLPGGVVILGYGDRTALWAFEGSSARYAAKVVSPATTIRRVRVGGAPAVWLHGASHTFVAEGSDGVPVEATAALVDADVLVWHERGVAYRLETRDGLGRALAVARSLR